MQLRFYPYDFDYKLKQGKVFMHLYSKLEDGTKICVVHEHFPAFFVSVKDIDTAKFKERLNNLSIADRTGIARASAWEEVEKELLGRKQKFWKITANYPKAVPLLAKELQSWGVDCYEKDIIFTHRYLRDTNIVPMTLIEAKGNFVEEEGFSIPLFQATSVKQKSLEPLQKWKILAVDIETYAERRELNPEKNPILMISFYGVNENGEEFKKVITWKIFNHKLDYLEVVGSEEELVQRFREVVKIYQPDILTGYFSDGFDLPYLRTRALKYQISLDLGLDRSEMQVQSKGGFRSSEAKIKGILHLDVFKFIKHIFGLNLRTDSYSLNSVAKELLGHQKHDVDLGNLASVWDESSDQLGDFCTYNLHDSHLTYKLCQQLLPHMIEFTLIVGVPTYDLIRMRFSRLVENYILKRAIEQNVLAPNKPNDYEISQRMEERIQGAFVFQPTPGLYEDIVVFDFRSLYPTIITAHNIGPESFKQGDENKGERVPEREGYWFSQEKAFIPSVLEHLIQKRTELKKIIREKKSKGKGTEIEDAQSYALKILANSFYGYLGFYGARWYCLECADSTTAYARNYIKTTIEKAEKNGFRTIYADTDSCFLLLEDQNLDSANKFMDKINKDLPDMMELEFEGYFSRGIFVAVKGTGIGAKKKYALINEDGNLKITGFETVRRNWSLLAKQVQEEVLRMVLSDEKEEALQYVKAIIEKLKSGGIKLDKLVLKTQITRELSQYKSIGPHVLVARKMEEKGYSVVPGTVVEYVIVKGSGLVRERAKLLDEVKDGGYDADYYLHHQLLPAVSEIFVVLGNSEDEILGKGKQKGLGDFF